MSVSLEARAVEFRYNNSFLLRDISLTVEQGDFLGIIGPNGSGKSTLLRLLAGYLRPRRGKILLDGRDIAAMSRKQVARRIAVVSQGVRTEFEFSVEDMVRLGRLPYLARWQGEAPGDGAIITAAMDTTGVTPFRHRLFTRLSGGEAQRVLLAQALAQQPDLLLLDEPTAYLDMAHQQDIFNVLLRLNRQGVTVVAVLHDLNMSALYCRRLIALKKGELFSAGNVDEVITADNIGCLYGCKVEVARHPHFGKPQVTLLPADSAGPNG